MSDEISIRRQLSLANSITHQLIQFRGHRVAWRRSRVVKCRRHHHNTQSFTQSLTNTCNFSVTKFLGSDQNLFSVDATVTLLHHLLNHTTTHSIFRSSNCLAAIKIRSMSMPPSQCSITHSINQLMLNH